MKIKNFKFSGKISYNRDKCLYKYKPLLLKILNDDDMDFSNYVIREDRTCVISVVKDDNYGSYNSSYFIYWHEGSSHDIGKYLRIEEYKGLCIGYKQNDRHQENKYYYINFLVSYSEETCCIS